MLRTPGLLALFVAKLLSTFGSWLTLLALPWFVLVTTGSPVKMSAVLAAEFLGVVTLGLPSGRVVARLGVRRTMLICDAARVPLMALIPLLHQAGWLSLPALLVVSFSLGVFTAPYVSSQRLILADLLGPTRGTDEKLLARANSLIDGATRVAALAGPALGGLLIALLGPAQVLWIDAGTYLISYLILAFFVRPPAPVVADTNRASPRASDERAATFAGLRHALRHRALRLFVLALTLVTTSVPAVFICLQVLVMDELGGDPRTLGLLTGANGAGLAIGSLVAVAGLGRMNNTALTGAAMLQCAPLWLLLVDHALAVAGGLFLVGLATPLLAATVNTRVTLRTPAPIRPHVMTAVTTTENLAAFVGYTAAGPALQLSGLRTVLAVIATLAALGAITFAMALRADDSPPALPNQRPREPRRHRRTPAIHEPATGTERNP
ncbi:MFS transporter [Micromonospora terminaliae]|uniref:MFS transporter n=1 Tax=Micromonospora terminaliae TaxID=1914461 RepID=A0AAJ3DIL7_9ACTN|nr:MFS transporter [Micromonospora terminaliae]NES27934.1 MFS transporter [Micromonospora terminaliae]QGL47298.1 MFS transporter [Micromonospora terminaliae]